MGTAERRAALLQSLRRGGWITAEQCAHAFDSTVRTIYRDVVALRAAGLPIVGEAGSGYRIDPEGILASVAGLTVEELVALLVHLDGVNGQIGRARDQLRERCPEALRAVIDLEISATRAPPSEAGAGAGGGR